MEYGKQAESLSLPETYTILARIYFENENFKKAITILEDWKAWYLKTNNIFNANTNLLNLGVNYMFIKNYDKAFENLQAAHTINLTQKDTLNLFHSYTNLANLYYEQYKDSLAIPLFKKALETALFANDITLQKDAYDNMALVEENRKDYQKMAGYLKEVSRLKDSIWNRGKLWELSEKDKAIVAAINKEKLNTEKAQKITAMWVTGIVLILLVLSLYFGINIYRQRKLIIKQKENLKDLNTFKDELFSVLGHDLRSLIQHVMHLNDQMRAAKNKVSAPKEEDCFNTLLEKHAIATQKLYFVLNNLLHWMLGQNKKGYFKIELHPVKIIVAHVIYDFSLLIAHKNLNIIQNIEEGLYVACDVSSLKIVLRNVLDNAIKFTPKNGNIIFEAYKSSTSTAIKVIDTGIGYKTKVKNSTKAKTVKQSTGLGLWICKSYVARNKGTFSIFSEGNSGTTVTIKLPNVVY